MITIIVMENDPWCLWHEIYGNMDKIGRLFGEWAWVGRVL
jgi:hypothetical protein